MDNVFFKYLFNINYIIKFIYIINFIYCINTCTFNIFIYKYILKMIFQLIFIAAFLRNSIQLTID